MTWSWTVHSDLPWDYEEQIDQYYRDLTHPKEGEWFRAIEPHEHLEVGDTEAWL